MSENMKIGEIIDVNTTSFSAECVKLNEIPSFGGLVRTPDGDRDLYAVVTYATTSSIDAGRHPVARGNDDEENEMIFKANPQLEKLFRSEFRAVVVGYKEKDRFSHHLPPKPARIHYSVYDCSDEEIRAFSEDLSFLSLLFNTNENVSTEELVSAVIRTCAEASDDKEVFLEKAGRELAKLLNRDYMRLKMILERIRPQEDW